MSRWALVNWTPADWVALSLLIVQIAVTLCTIRVLGRISARDRVREQRRASDEAWRRLEAPIGKADADA